MLVWLTVALTENLTAPWVPKGDWNGFLWSQSAHNHLHMGLRHTLGASSWLHFGPPPIQPDEFYVHHPPLLSLLLAAMFVVLGEHEWVARLLPILFSLATALLLWQTLRECVGTRAATLGAAVFAACPMELHFGKMVNFEPLMLVWMLVALRCLQHWQEDHRTRWLAATLGAFALGLWTEWPMYILAAVVAAMLFAQRRPPATRAAWMIIGLTVMSVILIFLHIRLVRPDAWQDALGQLQFRLSSDPGRTARDGTGFTAGQWFIRQGEFLSRAILLPMWALAASGAVYCWRKRRCGMGLGRLSSMAIALFATAVLYLVICRNVAYSHDYASFYFLLPVALMGGLALDAALNWWETRATSMWARYVGMAVLVAAIAGLCTWSRLKSHGYDSHYYMLEWGGPEPEDLIPSLGRDIEERFPANGRVLCNFPWQSPQLQYYAQRVVLFQKTSYDEWQPLISSQQPVGGVIWLGAEGATQLLKALPTGQREIVQFGKYGFCFWKPG